MRNITYANGEQIDIVTKNEIKEAETEGIESTSIETSLNVAVGTAGVTGEEHSDRSTVNEESSILLFVSNDMSEEKKTVKKQARQQQQMRLRRFQKRRGNPETH